MNKEIVVSTPSRICLFGEHQDYLGLEVIASAINLRFYAQAKVRSDKIINLKLTGEDIEKYEKIDLSKPITYQNNRDYLKSAVNVLLRKGYKIEHGYDINMDSEIPIGKGMCSSTTMIIVFIKVLLEMIDSEDKDNPDIIANLGFDAEVTEFNEPGGLMDHYTSCYGGLVHLRFDKDNTIINKLDKTIPGNFILIDSLQDKDTTAVLANAKYPVLEALDQLKEYGICSVRDFIEDEDKIKYLNKLDELHRQKLEANIDNYKVLLEGLKLLQANNFDDIEFGKLLKRHHRNLRDGLGISTPRIEEILNTAYENGALGGKINGSGGGGCCYVYSTKENSNKIVSSINKLGYNALILEQDRGMSKDKEISQ